MHKMDSEEFSASLQKAYQQALEEADKIRAQALEVLRTAEAERDAAVAMRKTAEQEGEAMASSYYRDRQREFREAAQTELLRRLVRHHLEKGETAEDIAKWLKVPMDFIQQISDYLQRLTVFRNSQEPQLPGHPRLTYKEEGRSGTVTFNNDYTQFELWWEFAGDDTLVILSIPDAQSWEIRTGLPLKDRETTLNFIGEKLVKDKINSAGAFHIGDTVISFYGPF